MYKKTLNNQSKETFLYLARLKNNIWLAGIPTCLFGVTDRSIAALADSYLSSLELAQVLVTSLFFVSWLCLNPNSTLRRDDLKALQSYKPNSNLSRYRSKLSQVAQGRMYELQQNHLISQEYLLPFPYVCQIYHLLNLKHLEHTHSFSLGNLKVINVSAFHPTHFGGSLKFQTVLDSQVNILKIWRQPIVEVELVLHSPYTVELKIPVYNDKYMAVIFNVFPINATEHQLLIDIYSNLEYPKPLLQMLLHCAACLTLFEDLPYLQKLARRNRHRLMNASRGSSRELSLYRRFVDLYGKNLQGSETPKVTKSV
jgi:hypothetical protein